MWKTIAKAKRKAGQKTRSEEFGISAEPSCSTLVTFVHSLSVLCPFSFCVRYFPRCTPKSPLQLSTVHLAMSWLRIPHCTRRAAPVLRPHMILFGGGSLLIHIQILRIRHVKLKAKTKRYTQPKSF